MTIIRVFTDDKRFQLKEGEGADSVHTDPVYAYAVTYLHTDARTTGIGLTFNLERVRT